jgi:hypothetical protein
MRMPYRGAGLLLLLGLAGCAVGPNYQMPDMRVPARWSEAPPQGVTTQPRQVTRWWGAFNDPRLDSLIERAVASNLDLRQAEARVREARALRGVAGLVAYSREQVRRHKLIEAVEANQRAVELANELYNQRSGRFPECPRIAALAVCLTERPRGE